MALRIPWDKHEVAILIDASLKVINKEISQKSAVMEVSKKLRLKAEIARKTIDEKYRNENGISMQMNIIIALILNKKSGLHKASKLFTEVVNIYKSNTDSYLHLLEEAIRLCQSPEEIRESLPDKATTEQIVRVETYVLKADLKGCTVDETAKALELSVLTVKKVVASSMNIITISDRLIHKDVFVDWEVGADCLQAVLEKLMEKNNGYVSAAQLYDYAKLDLTMFMNDNNMADQRKIYDMAEHLFSKEKYHDVKYSFQGNAHITRSQETVTSKLDIIKKFARDEGGFFSEENLEEYLHQLGINNTHARQYMKVTSAPDFLFYEPGYIITAESIGITPNWLDKLKKALGVLFDDVGDHIIIRDIQPTWYELLPKLPGGRKWTPLLLQSLLRFYFNEVGAKTICALETQTIETLHAMLVSLDSEVQTFSDAVLSLFVEKQITLLENRVQQYSCEELRQILVEYGLIAGRELVYTMPEALPNDGHFIWNLDHKNVTIKI